MEPIEILGLAATIFVLVSFLFKNIIIIRCINIVGCIAFVIYGAIISAWSVWIMNALLAIIHVVYIIADRIKKKKTNRPND